MICLQCHGAVDEQAAACSRCADRLGGTLAMRSGVATGLVVTKSAEEKTGRHGITGDINDCWKTGAQLLRVGEVGGDARSFSQGKVPIATQTLEAVIATTEQFGYEYVGTSANAFYGIVSAAMGNLGIRRCHYSRAAPDSPAGGQTESQSDFYGYAGQVLSLPGSSKGIIGRCGRQKRFSDARDYIARSIALFDRCGADVLLDEARAALDDLPR